MDITLLNVKITVEKNEVTVDEIGNRRNAWREYYSCFATVGGEGGRETSVAGITVDDSDISFSIRYCKAAKMTETVTEGVSSFAYANPKARF